MRSKHRSNLVLIRPQPAKHALSPAVDVPHPLHLVALLREIMLVDGHGVGPDDGARFLVQAEPPQGLREARVDQKLVAVADDVGRCVVRASDVGDGFVLAFCVVDGEFFDGAADCFAGVAGLQD